ncbi:hypothetical protein OH76DRAFT_1489379 [Lentinus brumalis]|uniref:Uncharacterized protein n=1 Tax=Lentinus brumalis TaxID=2498619 RepID=A0A371CMP6_9APHY|nr:hypothetical protein OH76DRAFT_1489379 [Polyporus brumalis]
MDALHCPQPSPPPSQTSPGTEAEAELEPHLGPKQTIPDRLMIPTNGKIAECIALWGIQWVLKRCNDAAFQPPPRKPRQPPPRKSPQPPSRKPRQPPSGARPRQVAEEQRSSTPILTASPAHQGHVDTAHPVPPPHQIPTAQRRLPVDRFSTSIAPHGGHGPPTSVDHPPPLTSEHDDAFANTSDGPQLVSCPAVQTASPAHQGHVNTAHPVPPPHQIPTAQRRLPVDRFSTSIAPHGGHGPPTSVDHPPPLTSEHEVLRTRSAHSWQHPGGVQHSAPPYPVSQPVIGDPRVQYASEIQHSAPPYPVSQPVMGDPRVQYAGEVQHGAPPNPVPQPIVGDPRVQYATAQASYAQPNGALPTANPYGVDSGAQQGTYVPTVSAQHAYNHAVMDAPDARLWVQTTTDDLLYQDESTTIYRSAAPARQWGVNVHQPLPVQAGQRSVNAYHPNPTQARQTRRSMHEHHPYPAQARQMRMSAHHPDPAQARQRTVTVTAYHPSPVQVGQWSEDVYHPAPVQAGHMPVDAYHPAPVQAAHMPVDAYYPAPVQAAHMEAYHPAPVQAAHMEAYQPYPAEVEYPAGPSHANWGAGVASSSTAQFLYFEV